jgi:hypothetical protein
VKLLLAGLLSAATVLSAAPAGADPFNPPCTITPEQSCEHNGTPPGQLVRCPETSEWVSEFHGTCASLWVGPNLPGNPFNRDDDR